ncbi:MAG: hypothetical protein KTR30_38755 [Saprospiraceae bacterium]|nr:hypothetical protein [Saprospiraceae bacterium]
MKKRLLILSDLWGFTQAKYLDFYHKQLESVFEVQTYDSCLLADLPQEQKSQAERHEYFVSGGIEVAVSRLIETEKQTTAILAFSVGGTIAWRAALAGMPVDQLFAISATRLRYEEQRPSCDLRLWYGALDAYQPKKDWYEKVKLRAHQWPNLGHDMYKMPIVIEEICRKLGTK